MPRRFTIGREKSCDVPIADDSVSRLHAEIWLSEDGKVMMADRGSSNGTVLVRNGETSPLTHAAVMPADQVRFGGITLSVGQVIEAIEHKNPGALTIRDAKKPPPLPPPPPPPAGPGASAPRPGGAMLVRCECGAIKTMGQVCPGCRR